MSKENSSLSWPRNTEGIKAAAERKRQEAFVRTEEGIKKLLREKKPVNFESVAETAKVTRAWLYKQPELRSRIETLRGQQKPKEKLPPQLRASDNSKDALIAELRKQNKELRAKNQELNKELEVVHGRALGLEELQLELQELQKQNQHLHKLLTESRAENEALRRLLTKAEVK